KLLFFTAVRVSELVSIKVKDVNFDQCKIFIAEGKGRKDRYILFPKSFRLVLQSHLRANPKNRYLFETTRYTPFTSNRSVGLTLSLSMQILPDKAIFRQKPENFTLGVASYHCKHWTCICSPQLNGYLSRRGASNRSSSSIVRRLASPSPFTLTCFDIR